MPVMQKRKQSVQAEKIPRPIQRKKLKLEDNRSLSRPPHRKIKLPKNQSPRTAYRPNLPSPRPRSHFPSPPKTGGGKQYTSVKTRLPSAARTPMQSYLAPVGIGMYIANQKQEMLRSVRKTERFQSVQPILNRKGNIPLKPLIKAKAWIPGN